MKLVRMIQNHAREAISLSSVPPSYHGIKHAGDIGASGLLAATIVRQLAPAAPRLGR